MDYGWKHSIRTGVRAPLDPLNPLTLTYPRSLIMQVDEVNNLFNVLALPRHRGLE